MGAFTQLSFCNCVAVSPSAFTRSVALCVCLPSCMLQMSYAHSVPSPCTIFSSYSLNFDMVFALTILLQCTGMGSCTLWYLSRNLSYLTFLKTLLCFMCPSQTYPLCLSFLFLLHFCIMLLSHFSRFFSPWTLSLSSLS